MKLRYKIAFVICLLGAFFLLGRCGKSIPAVPKPNAVLPSNDKERITFNEKTHTLTIQTATKTVKEYARNPDIQIRKDGSVFLQRHLTGFEKEPFIGIGYSDTWRDYVGANVFHISRFDLIGAIGFAPSHQYVALKPYIGVGWNFWSHTSINLVVNPLSGLSVKGVEIGGFVSVRL